MIWSKSGPIPIHPSRKKMDKTVASTIWHLNFDPMLLEMVSNRPNPEMWVLSNNLAKSCGFFWPRIILYVNPSHNSCNVFIFSSQTRNRGPTPLQKGGLKLYMNDSTNLRNIAHFPLPLDLTPLCLRVSRERPGRSRALTDGAVRPEMDEERRRSR
jgi:hypothetical protein